MASGIFETSLPTLYDYLKHNHFDNISTDDPKLVKLIEAHGIDAVCVAICQVSKRFRHVLKPSENIGSGVKLIKDYLRYGTLFDGLPVIDSLSISKTTGQLIPLLRWEPRENVNRLCPLRDSGFYCKNAEILNALEQAPERGQFSSLDEIQEIFSYLKKIIPSKYVDDGCVFRCFFVDVYLKHILKIPCRNQCVNTSSGKQLSLGPSYPQELHHQWMLHVVPSVLIKESKYILDMALQAPLLEEEWNAGVHNDRGDLNTIPISKWNKVIIDSEMAATSQIRMYYFQVILRAMYLFEKVDNNDKQCDRSIQTWKEVVNN
ncbi:MAG: protein-glutamine glutaminase family protein [Chlamydiota bacterium]